MDELGAMTMLVCSNVRPDAIDDDALAAEQLHALAERAAERGLRIAYEALAWGRTSTSYDHAWRIVATPIIRRSGPAWTASTSSRAATIPRDPQHPRRRSSSSSSPMRRT